jgi:hypothetical protein
MATEASASAHLLLVPPPLKGEAKFLPIAEGEYLFLGDFDDLGESLLSSGTGLGLRIDEIVGTGSEEDGSGLG